MPHSVSERSLVPNVCPVQLGNSEIVLEDDYGNSNPLDVEEYTCTNREVVNLENAALNIDNSSDVIIGPVTQFNVNGNVTIYQNGQNGQLESITETITVNHEEDVKCNGAKIPRTEKSQSEEQDVREINKHKTFVKIILLLALALLLLIGVIVTSVYFMNKKSPDLVVPSDTHSDNLGNHQLVQKSEWGGRPPKSYVNITSPVPMVIIKHTGGGTCDTFQVCAGKVQTIQSQGVASGLSDIKYSFLVGGDGNVYVGRGWDVQPATRNDTIDIAFMGSYDFDILTPEMIEAAQLLIADGLRNNKLTKDYKLVCHNQTEPTQSPGQNVYKVVKNWPHYNGGLFFKHQLFRKKVPRSEAHPGKGGSVGNPSGILGAALNET